MDINPAYSCLLGGPCIHSVVVVPSTLHQKLKFIVEGHLVIVSGEEDILVSCPSSMPYVVSRSFISAGLGHEGQVIAICEDDSPNGSDLVRPCPPGFRTFMRQA